MTAHIRVEFAALGGAAWQCRTGPELILLRFDRQLFDSTPAAVQPIAAVVIAHAIAAECRQGNDAALEWLFTPDIAAQLTARAEPAKIARLLLRSMVAKRRVRQ